ncbi:DUF1956 domain-containing protein, partial [bacterium]
AAVNYHFSDKQELYVQAVQHAHGAGITAIRALIEADRNTDPARRLHAFVHTFLQLSLDPGRPAWEAELINREMRDPTSTCDRYIADLLDPFISAFGSLIAELAGDPPPSARVTRLMVDSVMGQCLFYVYNKHKHARMFPHEPSASTRVDEIADHITRFSLAAIRCRDVHAEHEPR